MFSIGLTALSAALLEDFTYIYDIKLHTFNEAELKRRLDVFKVHPKYSEVLKAAIVNLCQVNPKNRMNSYELWKLVQPHEEKIRGSEKFVIDNAPDKLHKEVSDLKDAMPLLIQSFRQSSNNPSQINSSSRKI